jgi:hypothetical protein
MPTIFRIFVTVQVVIQAMQLGEANVPENEIYCSLTALSQPLLCGQCPESVNLPGRPCDNLNLLESV